MRLKYTVLIPIILLLIAPVMAADFSMTFEWGDLPNCDSGWPKKVPSPRFVLSNVPEETKFIKFIMTDKDVPNYNHGGGTITYTGNNIIEPGAFMYAGPCPPDGSHRYEWTAVAKKKKGFFGGSLGTAKAVKYWPE